MVGKVAKVVDEQTATVIITKVKSHPLYKKVIRVHKKYIAHIFPNQKVEIGKEVEIEESKPISKLKKWAIKSIK